MLERLLLALALWLVPFGAYAANCSSNPFTLTNGTTADATQVMANFNNLLNCANNNLAHNGANSDITSLSALSTPLSVPQGGTGDATLTANNLLAGNGIAAVGFIPPQTSGNVLVSNGTVWASGLAGVQTIADATNGGLNIINGTTNALINIKPSDLLTKVSPITADSILIEDSAATTVGKTSTVAAIITGSAATKAMMQAGVDNVSVVTPANVNAADGEAKVSVNFSPSGGGATINSKFNVTSVVRNAQGDYTINFTTAFAAATYGCTFGIENIAGDAQASIVTKNGGRAVGSIEVFTRDGANANQDTPASATVVCYGRQ